MQLCIFQGCKTEREDVIRMVLTASKRYPSVFQIQMAVTACLYNLTHEVSQKLHPHLLNEIVQSNLDAMEVFPQHHQMQKNCLLTMCSDRIINDVNFDRLRCAKLALNCLNEFQDGAMNRMSVAIISMLGTLNYGQYAFDLQFIRSALFSICIFFDLHSNTNFDLHIF